MSYFQYVKFRRCKSVVHLQLSRVKIKTLNTSEPLFFLFLLSPYQGRSNVLSGLLVNRICLLSLFHGDGTMVPRRWNNDSITMDQRPNGNVNAEEKVVVDVRRITSLCLDLRLRRAVRLLRPCRCRRWRLPWRW